MCKCCWCDGAGPEPQGPEIIAGYNGPFPRLRSLLCLAQRSFPLLSAVVPGPLLCNDGVGDLEGAISCATEAGCKRLGDRVRNPTTFGLMSTCHMTHTTPHVGEPIYHIDHYAEGASFSERTGRISIARPSGVSAIRSPSRHRHEQRTCRAVPLCPPRPRERL